MRFLFLFSPAQAALKMLTQKLQKKDQKRSERDEMFILRWKKIRASRVK
jgi:hypothetical protein